MENTLQLGNLLKEGTYPEEYTGGEKWTLLHGDTLKLVKAFQPGIFDAVITDPPYASGGTKQNERNRTTNQKYSSMKAENALPDFDGDNKDQVRMDISAPYTRPVFPRRSSAISGFFF